MLLTYTNFYIQQIYTTLNRFEKINKTKFLPLKSTDTHWFLSSNAKIVPLHPLSEGGVLLHNKVLNRRQRMD